MFKVPRLYLYLTSRAFQFNFSYRSREGFEGNAGGIVSFLLIFSLNGGATFTYFSCFGNGVWCYGYECDLFVIPDLSIMLQKTNVPVYVYLCQSIL